MNAEKTNLGVRPLGRGNEVSEVVAEENKQLSEFIEGTRKMGRVNSPEKAKEYRDLLLSYYDKAAPNSAKSLRKVIKGLGMS